MVSGGRGGGWRERWWREGELVVAPHLCEQLCDRVCAGRGPAAGLPSGEEREPAARRFPSRPVPTGREGDAALRPVRRHRLAELVRLAGRDCLGAGVSLYSEIRSLLRIRSFS